TTEISPPSLHDALPIFRDGFDVQVQRVQESPAGRVIGTCVRIILPEGAVQWIQADKSSVVAGGEFDKPQQVGEIAYPPVSLRARSEEHTSELQSRENLV